MSTFMLPEKGRNASLALARELADAPYDADWLQDLINERGKRAAKTGEGFEEVADLVAEIDRRNVPGGAHDDRNDTFGLRLKHGGREKPRPVFDKLELTDRRLEGYAAPADAWHHEATRFYAGDDAVAEDLLREGAAVDLSAGLAAGAADALAARGYERVDELGDEVSWAVMSGGDALPGAPRRVLVPADFRELARALAEHRWGSVPEVATFESVADEYGTDEEEAILARAGADVAGVYMYVSGSTAEEHGLTYEPVAGAVSRLGVFERTDDTADTMTDIQSLKGFHDRFPGEFAAWREVIDVVEGTAREFGFREVDTPAVERTELYRVKSGEELLDQTYSFEDRGGREVTLVPEQTPTRARMVQARKDLKAPVKWVDTSKRWRYENVQKGRDREFFQTDVDVVGIESVAADAEVIAVGATVFDRLGVADAVEFLVNDRQLLEALLEASGVENTTEAMKVIDDKEKLSPEEFRTGLVNVGVDPDVVGEIDALTDIRGPIVETVEELAERAPEDETVAESVERMRDLAAALESYGVADQCELDLSIVRGLAYYTGLVFEAFDVEGELRALFGGGRYDDLVGLFGDRELPAVGFAFGYSTTRELLQREGEWPAEEVRTDVYVLPVSANERDVAIEYATALRDAGLVVETDLSDRSVGEQFSYADAVNADYAVVVGERDLSQGVVTVQDMESGSEQAVDADAVREHFVETLGLGED
ncbi:MAG: histidine--tRNA ligase [Halobacteriaceae archaeon]